MDSDGIKYLIQNGLLEVGLNSEEVKIHNNQLVFTCSDTALKFRNDCGIIDTRAKYKDETLYETINLTSEYKISKNNLLVVKLQEQLKLSNQVGILLQPSQTLNAKHVFNHKVGAG